jgi:2-polyprenyl-6-methoxyphenol hydroxylase-like FAD-dependent oxidoreductase
MSSSPLSVRCCITGGGPAGMMLGFLLARAGVEVAVLEKHADFFRDFRGDTIHPSTLELMYELGLLDDFLTRPHDEVTSLAGYINDERYPIADFTHVPTHCKFLALMPQWDFLNFLAEHGKRYPAFHLLMQTEATGLLRDGEHVTGVCASTPQGETEIRADLTVGADGRTSTLRDVAGMNVRDFGAPMDVLWMRLSRRDTDPGQAFGYVKSGTILVLISRNEYWQCGYIIPKGSFDAIQQRGLEAFRMSIAERASFLSDRVTDLKTWDDVKLLTVKVDRLERWYEDGLLFIGDAAHAMSPVGGVGINLAIQDAVAAANILYSHFAKTQTGTIPIDALHAVQRRRTFPTVMMQSLQVLIQNTIISNVLRDDGSAANHSGNLKAPFPVRFLSRFPIFQRIPARVVGVGFRPEHIHTPEILPG